MQIPRLFKPSKLLFWTSTSSLCCYQGSRPAGPAQADHVRLCLHLTLLWDNSADSPILCCHSKSFARNPLLLIDGGAPGFFVSKSFARNLKGVSLDPWFTVVTWNWDWTSRYTVRNALLSYENGSNSVEDLIFAPIKSDVINATIEWRTKSSQFHNIHVPAPRPPLKSSAILNYCAFISSLCWNFFNSWIILIFIF